MANVIDIILRGKNEASTAIKQVKGDLTGLDSAATSATGGLSALGKAIPVAAIATAALKVGEMAVELGNLGQQVQQQRDYFEVWSGGVAAATTNLEAMRRAVGGALTESEMMAGANRLLSMGLADNANELENMSRMAVMLGGSTRSASESIEEFSLLLANQSIQRLDTFGISGANVRERIEELQAADANLSREQAFLNAVMEEGTRKVAALEAAGVKATTSAQDLGTAFRGLKEAIGEGLAQPVAEAQARIADTLNQLASMVGGTNILRDVLGLEPGSEQQLAAITARLAYLRDLIERSSAGENIYRFNTQQAQKEIADLEAKLIALTPANEAAGASSGVAAIRMIDNYTQAKNAAYDLADAVGAVAAANGIDWTAKARSLALVGRYEGITGAAAARQEETARAYGLLRSRETRLNLEKEANAKIAEHYVGSMKSAVNNVAGEVESAFSAAQSASKGLFDFTKGAGDLFAPGSNGPFEAIFRAQSIAVHGTGGANEQKWAQMYGLTQESAARIVADFQRGLFSPEVQGLINVDQLVGQIQSEQAAADSKTAFANMIAGKLGVKDAGALVASQTFQAIAGGVDADPTQQAGAAQKVLDAYLNNVNAVVTGKDYAGRMIAFGTTTWVYYEQGLLEGAKESAVFASAVDAAIGAWMARQAAPKAQGVVGAATSMGVTP